MFYVIGGQGGTRTHGVSVVTVLQTASFATRTPTHVMVEGMGIEPMALGFSVPHSTC